MMGKVFYAGVVMLLLIGIKGLGQIGGDFHLTTEDDAYRSFTGTQSSVSGGAEDMLWGLFGAYSSYLNQKNEEARHIRNQIMQYADTLDYYLWEDKDYSKVVQESDIHGEKWNTDYFDFHKGWALFLLNDQRSGSSLIARWNRLNPERMEGWVSNAQMSYIVNSPSYSDQIVEKARFDVENLAQFYSVMSSFYESRNDVKRMISMYREMSEVAYRELYKQNKEQEYDKVCAAIFSKTATVYIEEEDYAQARRALTRLLVHQRGAETYYARAQCYRHEGDIEKSEADFKMACSLDYQPACEEIK